MNNKYGVRRELESNGKKYIDTLIDTTSKEHAERIINDEMESYKRSLEHVNKTITLTLFSDDYYFRKDLYTKSIAELLNEQK